MDGYGEMNWIEGNKYIGSYKNDKKDGFGIYYSPKDIIFVGFWKMGKQEGFGKYINKNKIKYGVWKNGKKEKKYENEDDFYNDLNINNINYSIFQWNINKIKDFLELNE